MGFRDRSDAGRQLARRLASLAGEDVVVLGLPRGGVPVAHEVARSLGAPLDVTLVRKLGVPRQPELAMGAIGEDGVRVLNAEVLRLARVGESELDAVEQRERAELARRARRYRGDRPRVSPAGKIAVVVDDGIATGSTARAACAVARAHGARHVVLAVPVAPPASVAELAREADQVVCLLTPEPFFAVGEWYADFSQTTDDEVMALLQRAGESVAPGTGGAGQDLTFSAGGARLHGRLDRPAGARGLVVFAHGSGSSRNSPRNRQVAAELGRGGLATLLFDLLDESEANERRRVFDVPMLAARLAEVTAQVTTVPEVADLAVGYFGASTGAAAALTAAAAPGADIAAVVSRGGRPDLSPALEQVRAPTLLIVGELDEVVLGLNREARARLSGPAQLDVVPGATHLFEEPGALEQVAVLARDWFLVHLPPARSTWV
jgi:putative phosphoribosyl transferase